MNRVGKILIGAATSVPLVYAAVFIVTVSAFFPTRANAGSPPPDLFAIIFPLHLFIMAWSLGLTIFYVVNVFQSDRVDKDKKALWAVVLFLGNMMATPVYWYLYIWKEPAPAARMGLHDTAPGAKPLSTLTAQDLLDNPVWLYEGEDDRNAVVAPSRRGSLSTEEDDVYIAATEFTLANGARLLGFCSPVDDSGLDYLQPVMVLATGDFFRFWLPGPGASRTVERQLNILGMSSEEIFPVTYRCLVLVDGQAVEGELVDFELA